MVLGRGGSKGTRRAIGVRKVRAGRKKASYDRRRTMTTATTATTATVSRVCRRWAPLGFRISSVALHATLILASSSAVSACASSQGGRPTLPAPEYEDSPVPGSEGGLP